MDDGNASESSWLGMKDRFLTKFLPEPNTGCWLWTAAVDGSGYGIFNLGTRKQGKARAHRIAFELFVGPVPKDKQVCHKCDVRSCVNPDHLFVGTSQDNRLDCVSKGRNYRHCVLTEDQVTEIRTKAMTAKKYAAKFGVSKSAIDFIWQKRSWIQA